MKRLPRVLTATGLLLLGLLLGLAMNPVHVGADPSNTHGLPALALRVTALEDGADDDADRLGDLQQIVEGLVLALEELTLRVDELDGGGNGGGGGGGGGGCVPTGEEICDGIDNDCNGLVDEGFEDGMPCETEDGFPGVRVGCDCLPIAPP